jgi:AbrB family looped-hinge helix DNA binding protein
MYWLKIRPKKIYLLISNKSPMQATVKMARAGQVVIPIEVREALGLAAGDLIVIDVMGKVQKPSLQEQGNARGVNPVQA